MTTALQGTFNFRDLGGLPLEGGGTTAVGVLYRSDALHALTPAGEAESPCKDRTGGCAAVLLDAVGVTRSSRTVRPAAQSARSDLDVDD